MQIFWAKVQGVTKDLKPIWLSVNPRLPLFHKKSIDRKVKDLLLTVKEISRKHAEANLKRNLGPDSERYLRQLKLLPCLYACILASLTIFSTSRLHFLVAFCSRRLF